MRAAFALLSAVALAFLALPVAAIFLRVPPGTLLRELGDPVARDALVVSLKTSVVAQALVVALGTPTAYLLATHRFSGRSVLLTLVELPLVLPPAVAGIGLLAAFGRTGLLSTSVAFSQAAVVMAVAFVAAPFYVRTAVAAFEGVDPTLVAAARTLGARPWRVFARVALPLAAGGLGAGLALSFARGLGEFGATIMFAGSLQRVTQTLPLAIYAEFEQSFDVALAIGALLVAFSFTLLLAVKWLRSGWTSPSRFATSPFA
ncbi:MAG: molybdate ABC transporter permease subunit [Gaiellaceae bacterium]